MLEVGDESDELIGRVGQQPLYTGKIKAKELEIVPITEDEPYSNYWDDTDWV